MAPMEELVKNVPKGNATKDIEEWSNEVDEVTSQIRGIIDGTITDFDAFDKQLALKDRAKQIRKEEAEERRLRYFLNGVEGKGEGKKYKWWCKRCFVEYYIDLPEGKCTRCGQSDKMMSQQERWAELMGKLEDFKETKAKHKWRKDKWNRWKKSRNINYKAWEFWEPDTDSEEEGDPIVPKDNPEFMAMEADLKDRKKKQAEKAKTAERCRQRGNQSMSEGDFVGAIEHYDEGLEYRRHLKALWTNKALAELKVFRWHDAISSCNKVIEYAEIFEEGFQKSADACFKAFTRRAQALRALHKWEDALNDLEDAVALVPSSREALDLLDKTRAAAEEAKTAQKLEEDPGLAAPEASAAEPSGPVRVEIEESDEEQGEEEPLSLVPSSSQPSFLQGLTDPQFKQLEKDLKTKDSERILFCARKGEATKAYKPSPDQWVGRKIDLKVDDVVEPSKLDIVLKDIDRCCVLWRKRRKVGGSQALQDDEPESVEADAFVATVTPRALGVLSSLAAASDHHCALTAAAVRSVWPLLEVEEWRYQVLFLLFEWSQRSISGKTMAEFAGRYPDPHVQLLIDMVTKELKENILPPGFEDLARKAADRIELGANVEEAAAGILDGLSVLSPLELSLGTLGNLCLSGCPLKPFKEQIVPLLPRLVEAVSTHLSSWANKFQLSLVGITAFFKIPSKGSHKGGTLTLPLEVHVAICDFVEFDADDSRGVTALIAAASCGALESVKLLVSAQADLDKIGGPSDVTAVFAAAWYGHLEVVRWLIDQRADKDKAANHGETPAYIASQSGHLDVVRLLIQKDADMDKSTNIGATPLYIASQMGHLNVVRLLILKRHLEVVRLLIQKRADEDKATNRGETPVFIASQGGHLDVVGLLIEKDAHKDQATNHGETPVYVASQAGHPDVVRLLIEKRADKDKTAHDGARPFTVAAYAGHLEVVRLLIEKRADKDKLTNHGETPVFIASQGGHLDVDKGMNSGATHLFIASRGGHLHVVRLLIEQHADKNKAANHGETPVYIASQSGHLDVVRLLIEKRADKDKAAHDGGRPAMVAAYAGHLEVVRLLIEKRADKHKATNHFEALVFIASRGDHKHKAVKDGASPPKVAAYGGVATSVQQEPLDWRVCGRAAGALCNILRLGEPAAVEVEKSTKLLVTALEAEAKPERLAATKALGLGATAGALQGFTATATARLLGCLVNLVALRPTALAELQTLGALRIIASLLDPNAFGASTSTDDENDPEVISARACLLCGRLVGAFPEHLATDLEADLLRRLTQLLERVDMAEVVRSVQSSETNTPSVAILDWLDPALRLLASILMKAPGSLQRAGKEGAQAMLPTMLARLCELARALRPPTHLAPSQEGAVSSRLRGNLALLFGNFSELQMRGEAPGPLEALDLTSLVEVFVDTLRKERGAPQHNLGVCVTKLAQNPNYREKVRDLNGLESLHQIQLPKVTAQKEKDMRQHRLQTSSEDRRREVNLRLQQKALSQ
eukprot:s1054_g2.t1